MNVFIEKNSEQDRWWVRMDDWRVSFNTAAEAEQFAERLTTRLNAPHSLDMLADWSPRTGVADARNAIAVLPAQTDRRCVKEA
ncbi:hypothetical protein BGP84_10705 [Pseudomonas putida]|jgi:hypothetical protein|uniref:Uncharacterized protein n=1 Tax=Pseudomonas putida TaxID=303 RepID=A0A2S3X3W9_PSEPU|nr:hypothetical protein [Pseudomonas putida]POG10175.1 hypothetical protein BGP84_10705 [Pseudomonas putida]POG16318.1 hypothetical protein BGP85_09195 [Pseudomonas putida]